MEVKVEELTTAHVLINCDSGKEESVINQLKKFDVLKEVEPVYGAYDIVAKVELPTHQEIKDSILAHIRKINSVISTITLTHIDE